MKRKTAVGTVALWVAAFAGCETAGTQPSFVPGGEGGASVEYAGEGPSNAIDYHEVFSSKATWYATDGSGNCSYEPGTKKPLVVAVSNYDYDNSFACGAFLRVSGPLGTVTAMVTDRCAQCAPGELDLSVPAYKAIADVGEPLANVTWQFVEGDITGPLRYRLKTGSNAFWSAIQVSNHRHPIASVEVLRGDGTWEVLDRQNYNFFVYDRGWGNSPRDLRITDVFGQSVIDAAVVMKIGHDVPGSAQLPRLTNTVPATGSVADDAPGGEGTDGELPSVADDDPSTDETPGTGRRVLGPSASPGLEMRVEQETAWETGYCADVFLENVSDVPVEWQVTLPLEKPLDYVWSADYALDAENQVLQVFGHPWNAVMAPGDELDFGFCTEANP